MINLAIDRKTIELDRLMNMAKAFGWEQRSQRTDDDTIIVELVKRVVPEEIKPV